MTELTLDDIKQMRTRVELGQAAWCGDESCCTPTEWWPSNGDHGVCGFSGAELDTLLDLAEVALVALKIPGRG